MTVWLTRTHVATLGVRDALRGYWKRIAVGAFLGWLISTVLGAFALVGFESFHLIAADDSPLLGAAIVWMGIAVGGSVAYVARPIPIEEQELRR
jgi:hypothetical protein